MKRSVAILVSSFMAISLVACTHQVVVVVIQSSASQRSSSSNGQSSPVEMPLTFAPICHLEQCKEEDSNCGVRAFTSVRDAIREIGAPIRIKSSKILKGGPSSFYVLVKPTSSAWIADWKNIGCVSPNGETSTARRDQCVTYMEGWIKVLNEKRINGLEENNDFRRVCLRES